MSRIAPKYFFQFVFYNSINKPKSESLHRTIFKLTTTVSFKNTDFNLFQSLLHEISKKWQKSVFTRLKFVFLKETLAVNLKLVWFSDSDSGLLIEL